MVFANTTDGNVKSNKPSHFKVLKFLVENLPISSSAKLTKYNIKIIPSM